MSEENRINTVSPIIINKNATIDSNTVSFLIKSLKFLNYTSLRAFLSFDKIYIFRLL